MINRGRTGYVKNVINSRSHEEKSLWLQFRLRYDGNIVKSFFKSRFFYVAHAVGRAFNLVSDTGRKLK